jgi:predicted Zn-dependent protease
MTTAHAPLGVVTMKRAAFSILCLLTMAVGLCIPARAQSKKDNVNDIGKRRVAHHSFISEEKEIAIGKQYATEIDRSAKLITDPVVTEYVNRVAQNIARNSDLKIPLTVKVIDSPQINAFALPGGFLYVNSGLIMAATEEDQIAGVIGHEIAHDAARHWASMMTKQTILQFATIPLMFTPMSYPLYIGLVEGMNFGVPIAFLKFSRADEAEADFLGLQYMYKAGYDPNAYVAFFSKVVEDERRMPGSVPAIFSDHPPTGDRIIKCEEEIKTLLPQKPEYLVSTSEFNDVKARLETVVTAMRIQQKGENEPTLQKPQPDKNGKTSDDKPPVLKRPGN